MTSIELLKEIADSAAADASSWRPLENYDSPEDAAKCWLASEAALRACAAAYAAMAAKCGYERADMLADLAADDRHERRKKGLGR